MASTVELEVPSRETRAGLPPGSSAPAALQLAQWLYRPLRTVRKYRARYGVPFTMRFPAWPAVVTFAELHANRQIFAGSYEDHSAGQANEPLRPVVGGRSLLLLDGDRHRRERKMLTPPFHGARMTAYGEVMREVAEASLSSWPLGEVFPVQPHTQSITLDIILRTVFGAEEGPVFERLRAALASLMRDFSNPALMVPKLHVDLGPRSPWGRYRRTRERTHRRLDEFIEHRRADRSERHDILAMLLAARYEDGRPMTSEELRDELLTLLVAGHETTATALSWALHHLATHPTIQRQVHAELDAASEDAALEMRGGGLALLDAVIKETLRLYPVVAAVGRVLHRPMILAGWEIPAGTLVAANIYLTHHDPKIYARPEAFSPDHFLGRRRSPHEFFPFGGGVRRCIGAAFALYEMRVVLAAILKRHRVWPALGHRVEPVRRNVTIGPTEDAPIVIERR